MNRYFCGLPLERPRVKGGLGRRSLGTHLRLRAIGLTADECERWSDKHASESRISNSMAKRGNISRGHKRRLGAVTEPNDWLTPLDNFFFSRLGRQWDTVYSEIRHAFKVTSMAQNHVYDHLIERVSAHVVVQNGKLCSLSWLGRYAEVTGFYVNPLTRTLEHAGYHSPSHRQSMQKRAHQLTAEPWLLYTLDSPVAYMRTHEGWVRAEYRDIHSRISHEHRVNCYNEAEIRKVQGFDRRDLSLVRYRNVTPREFKAISELAKAKGRLYTRPRRHDLGIFLNVNPHWQWGDTPARYVPNRSEILWPKTS